MVGSGTPFTHFYLIFFNLIYDVIDMVWLSMYRPRFVMVYPVLWTAAILNKRININATCEAAFGNRPTIRLRLDSCMATVRLSSVLLVHYFFTWRLLFILNLSELPLGLWTWLTLGTCFSPSNSVCHHIEFSHCRSNSTNVRTYIRPNKWTPRVPRSKVTQSHWNRHGSIGYLWLPVSDPK